MIEIVVNNLFKGIDQSNNDFILCCVERSFKSHQYNIYSGKPLVRNGDICLDTTTGRWWMIDEGLEDLDAYGYDASLFEAPPWMKIAPIEKDYTHTGPSVSIISNNNGAIINSGEYTYLYMRPRKI